MGGIYAWGVGQHRTLFENSILSTTILSVAFFLFITINLYRGVKLKDDIGYLKPGKPNFNKAGPDITSHLSVLFPCPSARVQELQQSKGNLMERIRYGLAYTLLHNSWIYARILILGYLKK
jgi:hypothetical protein